jgi:multiple sugar transport system permease protein
VAAALASSGDSPVTRPRSNGTLESGPIPRAVRPSRSGTAQRSARLGYGMSLPAIAVVALVTIAPIVLAVAMSFTHVSILPGGLSFSWSGLANYRGVVSNSLLRDALLFTLEFTVVSVAIGLVVGTAIALVLDEMTKGRTFVLVCILIPYSVIAVIGAELWAYILNGVYGVANYLLISLHIISHPATFLNSTQGAFWSIMVADSWKSMPFVTLIVLAGLRSIDRELYAAAQVDGAHWISRVTRITLPLIKPALLTAAIFRILQCFGVFDVIYILTGGGPGDTTQSIAMLMYQTLFESFNLSAGSTISTITTVIVLLIALSVLKVR